jgi:hypothetical protein
MLAYSKLIFGLHQWLVINKLAAKISLAVQG